MDIESFALSPLTLLPTFLFVLFLHGGLLVVQARALPQLRPLLSSYSVLVLAAFFLSLLINLVFFLVLSLLDISMGQARWLLLLLDTGLLGLLLIRRQKVWSGLIDIRVIPAEKALLALVLMVAVIMARNGGLIDMLADSWWHMSLASRLLEDGSIFSTQQHLIGFPTDQFKFDYPFLWHASLALISQVSGSALPVIWHAIAVIAVGLSLLAYFTFCLALSREPWMALLATLLFCLLYGGLNSYFRVMPWPGDISYIGMYFCLYVYFTYLYNMQTDQSFVQTFQQGWPYLLAFFIITLCMAAIHGVALLLFIISIGLFLYAALAFSLLQPEFIAQAKIKSQLVVMVPILMVGIGMGLLLFPHLVYAVLDRFNHSSLFIYSAYLFIPILLVILFRVFGMNPGLTIRGTVFILWAAGLLLYSVDGQHLAALFVGEAQIGRPELPKSIQVEGISVLLPNWVHQLRGGLLYSGLLSIPLSLVILYLRQDTAGLFLGANAIIAGLALTSPMLFWLVTAAIQNTSSYRIHLLIFHPVIYATAIIALLKVIRRDA